MKQKLLSLTTLVIALTCLSVHAAHNKKTLRPVFRYGILSSMFAAGTYNLSMQTYTPTTLNLCNLKDIIGGPDRILSVPSYSTKDVALAAATATCAILTVISVYKTTNALLGRILQEDRNE